MCILTAVTFRAPLTVNTFIEKWRASGASERSNYALFFSELCDVLGVPRPDPATDTPENDGYVIDRVVTLDTGATNYIDLYKRGCFVAEAPTFGPAVVARLALLNAELAGEETRGQGRYIRPEFQNPAAGGQTGLDVATATVTVNKAHEKQAWPASMSERVVAVRQAVTRLSRPAQASEVAARFTRARAADVANVLDALGLVQRTTDGAYSA